MFGPYPLTPESVDNWVLQPTGTYALGNIAGNFLYPDRVGRSVGDLAGRIKDYRWQHPFFLVQYASSAIEAYHQECDLYHRCRPRNNPIHPAKPLGYTGYCLICFN